MVLKNEVKVGIFSFLALAILFSALFLTNTIRVGIQGYLLNVRYTFVNDLREGAPVIVAGGVRVGYVREIKLVNNQLNVQLWISKKHSLDKSARFIIYTTGLMGDKYIEVEVETPSGEYFAPNDIVDGISPVSFDGLSIKIGNTLNSLFGGAMNSQDIQKSFLYLFKNTSELMYGLNETVKYSQPEFQRAVKSFSESLTVFREQLVIIMNALNASSKGLERVTVGNADRINEAIVNLQKVSTSLVKSAENLSVVLDNTKDITTAIRKEQGTLGGLIYNKDLYKTVIRAAKNFEAASEKFKQSPKVSVW